MKRFRGFSILLCILLLSVPSRAQWWFTSLSFSHSIVSNAMGGQGVTLPNAADAMQYNPANLARIDGLSMSFYRYPYPQERRPLTAAAMSYRLSRTMTLGFEYNSFDDRYIQKEAGRYERSAAAAAAMQLGNEWAVGAEVNYLWISDRPPDIRLKHFIVSAGASYTPEALSDRLHAGLSFTNFSTPAHFELWNLNDAVNQSYVPRPAAWPVPSQINLGADWSVVRDRSFDLTMQLGFTKWLEKYDHNSARSSFYALFTDWDDFPKYLGTHAGAAYRWKTLPLGHNVSYFQEMYLGYYSSADIFFLGGWYTHGARMGLEISGVKAGVGYAGLWHNVYEDIDLFYHNRLSETFQFDVSADLNKLGGKYDAATGGEAELSGILVSGGYTYCAQLGRMKRSEADGSTFGYRMPSLLGVESDFYLDDRSALTAALGYGRMVQSVDPPYYYDWIKSKSTEEIETISLESGYRYHPIEAIHSLFLQAAVGIIRFNPVNLYKEQRHLYYPYGTLAIGCAMPLGKTGVTMMPKAGFKSILMENFPEAYQLVGFNQIGVGINIGYKL